MAPRQSEQIDERRAAFAPYNFVPLPERVVEAQELLPQDRYYPQPERITGRIDCVLTTETPLYVRCGLTPKQFADGLEAKDQSEFFYLHGREQPVIPGSSLRGMLRSLVEIVSYGKIERVPEHDRYFYRAVAAKGDDPLAHPYRTQLKNVRAGYLELDGETWYIRPARREGREAYLKAREIDIPTSLRLPKLSDVDAYRPDYREVSFTTKVTRSGRPVIDLIGPRGAHRREGVLVASGNMLETGKGAARSPRKNHAVVLEPSGEARIPIDQKAIEDYCAGLTEFQKQDPPFTERRGVLRPGRVVFYCEPGQRDSVVLFGASPNFRVPYRPPGHDHAAGPLDFVPRALRDDGTRDIADAIFGYVRRHPVPGDRARAGRVFVGDAMLQAGQADVWYSEEPLTPRILATPKPTTFQHYLVQPGAAKRDLRHYGSEPGHETTIRGHKLYWHKGAAPDIELPAAQQKIKDTQKTKIRPVRAGLSFAFSIHFENLSRVELGALLWVLRVAGDDRYRLALGMGKPLGMGAVRLTHTVVATDRRRRYGALFGETGWETGETRFEEVDACVQAFNDYVIDRSGEKAPRLEETLRIQCLLLLLSWPGPLVDHTRYMEIEYGPGKVNEYRERPVLPTPHQVMRQVAPAASTEIRQPLPEPTSQEPTPPTPVLPPPPPPSPRKKLEQGVEVTGNRKGELRVRNRGRGVRVDLNLKEFALPKNRTVIGFIPRFVAGSSLSGGFRGEIEDVEIDGETLYLILKPKG